MKKRLKMKFLTLKKKENSNTKHECVQRSKVRHRDQTNTVQRVCDQVRERLQRSSQQQQPNKHTIR
jgi:hypothetical protein